MKEKICLILEGGGAKCAYQWGALEAIKKMKCKIVAIGGTSFGAVNAALYIGGGLKKMTTFWENLKPSEMFNEDMLDDLVEKIYRGEKFLDVETIAKVCFKWKNPLQTYNQVSSDYQRVVQECVDEKRIRKSKLDFGLVTLTLPNNFMDDVVKNTPNLVASKLKDIVGIFKSENRKIEAGNVFQPMVMNPVELFKEEIPLGKLPLFVAASANNPMFKPLVIDGKNYIDGGLWDNVPINLMSKKGYRKFLVLRTNLTEPRKMWPDGLDIEYLTPSKELGNCAMFAPSNIAALRQLGYDDMMNFIKNRQK